MSYRNVIIESDAKLSLKDERLMIERGAAVHYVPVEDIDILLIESRQSVLTAALLTKCAEHGAAVFFCDERHIPSCVLLPFAGHSRSLEVARAQLGLSEPSKKRLWQQLVQQKIENQAEVLKLLGDEVGAGKLYGMAKTVASGDSGNVEAVAAAYYFPRLFGASFTRDNDDDTRNAALNYGYAIMRGAVARSVAVHGLLPAVGVHHHSVLNPFNLADDLIEPLRPIVDLFVATEAADTLSPSVKRALVGLLSADVLLGGKRYAVSYAAQRLAESLLSKELKLPKLLPLSQHEYE
ncbi:CRISPR-associated endonuclease Cas1 [Clostridia bacterium]|nr:CRISPR-associated endonuclease Cas1 [Clostridia bacterium]